MSTVSYTCSTLSHEDTGLNFIYAGLGCVATAGVSVHLSRGCVFSMLEGGGKMQGELGSCKFLQAVQKMKRI